MLEETKPIETQIATLDVRDASAQGLALMESRTENQKKMLAIAIKLTSPNQWVVFAGKDRESIYPTGGAADTVLRRAFGCSWAEKEITVEDTSEGRLATCSAWLMNGDQRLEHFTGFRFIGGYIKNEADLRKGAMENMKSVACRDLLGLRFRTPNELKEMGLDVNKLKRRAEFQDHAKDPGSLTVPFGREKGKLITDISEESLKWLAEAVKKSIADPEKAKWKDKNQQTYDALRAEYLRRHPEAAGTKNGKVKQETKPTDEPPHDPKTGETAPPEQGEFDGVGPKALTDEEVASMREPGEEG